MEFYELINRYHYFYYMIIYFFYYLTIKFIMSCILEAHFNFHSPIQFFIPLYFKFYSILFLFTPSGSKRIIFLTFNHLYLNFILLYNFIYLLLQKYHNLFIMSKVYYQFNFDLNQISLIQNNLKIMCLKSSLQYHYFFLIFYHFLND